MITTTTVGCHPLGPDPRITRRGDVIDAPEHLRSLFAGPALRPQLERLALGQIRKAISEQDALGLDVLAEGEVTRREYWSYFILSLAGTEYAGSTTVTAGAHEGEMSRVRVTGPLAPRDPFLVTDWAAAQAATTRPVKVTIPAPLTCATYVADEHYGSRRELADAFAAVINQYVLALVDAGCRHIQVDAPQLAYQVDAALEYGAAAVARCFEGVPPEVTRYVHVCRGTPPFPQQYENTGKAPDPRCYERLLPALAALPLDVISVEHAFHPNDAALFAALGDKRLMLGVVDVATLEVESVEQIVERARPVLDVVGRDRLMLAPDCGFSAWNAVYRGTQQPAAFAKLRNMVAAAEHLRA
jgi:5-methyltetrahydropteroyltriglutamate--homocysteine methyltransferase